MKSKGAASKSRAEPIKQCDEPVLQSISGFVFETDFESIPKEVIHQARLSLLDTLGGIIRGSSLPEAKQVIHVEKEIGGKEQATIIGAGDRVAMAGAARVNGYMGDILEFNGLIYGHSGIGIIPTSLAVAETLKCSGKASLSSIVLGYEVSGRIYQAYYDYKKE